MLRWASAVAISLTALPACAVRLRETPRAFDRTAAPEPQAALSRRARWKGEGANGHVPSIEEYTRRWSRFRAAEESEVLRLNNLSAQLKGTARIRMVLGVFSTSSPEDAAYRDVIRSTWLRQPGVCVLDSTAPAANCSVYVTFVVGNNGSDTGEDDLTILPIPENMNQGKTPTWFHHASRSYTWATHVAKMDLDTYPHLAYILYWTRVRQAESNCSNVFGGRPGTCDHGKLCPPRRCGPSGDDFLQYSVKDPSCWSYMHGALYFLSRELAEQASEVGGFWDRQSRTCQPEDLLAGRAVHDFASGRGACVAAVKLADKGAYWHPRYKRAGSAQAAVSAEGCGQR